MRAGLRTTLAIPLAAVMTGLAGCGTLDTAGPGNRPAELLAYYRYAGALDEETRAHEYRNFRNWVRPGRCGPDRIRLAMLIMHGAGQEGEADASAVLGPCLEGEKRPAPHLRNLANLLDHQLALSRQLSERIAELEARRNQLSQRLTQTQKKRNRLRQNVESLQEQLEALKDIERSIRQRE